MEEFTWIWKWDSNTMSLTGLISTTTNMFNVLPQKCLWIMLWCLWLSTIHTVFWWFSTLLTKLMKESIWMATIRRQQALQTWQGLTLLEMASFKIINWLLLTSVATKVWTKPLTKLLTFYQTMRKATTAQSLPTITHFRTMMFIQKWRIASIATTMLSNSSIGRHIATNLAQLRAVTGTTTHTFRTKTLGSTWDRWTKNGKVTPNSSFTIKIALRTRENSCMMWTLLTTLLLGLTLISQHFNLQRISGELNL